MKIFIGADHRGYGLKEKLEKYLHRAGYEVEDVGADQLDNDDDFPKYAAKVANSVLSGDGDSKGILLCGSGQGVCMAANRFRGIRAAVCWDRNSAHESRNDDDANIVCLPANDLDEKPAEVIVETFLNTPFAGAARFTRRIQQIDKL